GGPLRDFRGDFRIWREGGSLATDRLYIINDMTRPVIKKVTCSDCGAKGDFIVYTSINLNYNSELAEKMKNGDLFIWECPKCKKKHTIPYGIMICR
ncbi:MAG: CpXC domain-containing protein, partial [Roseburia sp.]|nr:CpXC domain-containing protein [Roseburia sp.]